jgi:hypothetical protein
MKPPQRADSPFTPGIAALHRLAKATTGEKHRKVSDALLCLEYGEMLLLAALEAHERLEEPAAPMTPAAALYVRTIWWICACAESCYWQAHRAVSLINGAYRNGVLNDADGAAPAVVEIRNYFLQHPIGAEHVNSWRVGGPEIVMLNPESGIRDNRGKLLRDAGLTANIEALSARLVAFVDGQIGGA